MKKFTAWERIWGGIPGNQGQGAGISRKEEGKPLNPLENLKSLRCRMGNVEDGTPNRGVLLVLVLDSGC
jgi:hypothetical protein